MRNASLLKTLCLTCFTCLSWTAGSAYAAPVPGDFEGDGLSDLSTVTVNRDAKKTTWTARLSSGQTPFVWNFNVPADALVTGRYYQGYPRTIPGIVYVRDAAKPLEWYFKTQTGGEISLQYGVPGDSVPNQGDLDCDGVADITVARNGRPGYYDGFKLWYVNTSHLAGNIQEMQFGLASDRIGIADVDGDGCDELLAVRVDSKGFLHWFSKKLYDPQEATKSVQWGLTGDIPLLPQDITGDGKPEYVIARIEGENQTAYIRNGDNSGQFSTRTIGPKTTVPMIGNFFGSTGFGWQQRSTGFTAQQFADGSPLVFKHGNATDVIVRPDGTVVQPGVTGQIGVTSGGTSGGSSSSPSPSGNNDGVECNGSIKLNDGGGGFVNNPHSSRKSMKINFPANLTGNIRKARVYSDGKVFDTLYFGGYEYGGRERHYGTKSIGSYPDNVLLQTELTSGRYLCVTIPDPQRRYD